MSWVNTSYDVHFWDLTIFLPNQKFIVKEDPTTGFIRNFPRCDGNLSQVTYTIKKKGDQYSSW